MDSKVIRTIFLLASMCACLASAQNCYTYTGNCNQPTNTYNCQSKEQSTPCKSGKCQSIAARTTIGDKTTYSWSKYCLADATANCPNTTTCKDIEILSIETRSCESCCAGNNCNAGAPMYSGATSSSIATPVVLLFVAMTSLSLMH